MSNLSECRLTTPARAAAIGLLLLGGATFGQTAVAHPVTDALTFDVATVRPTGLDRQKFAAAMQAGRTPRMGPRVDGLRAEYSYMTLRALVAIAYKMRPILITGPNWLDDERYDIEARMPVGSSKNDASGMLQTLLKERFKLTVHSETHERSVLALVVASGGPKLKESTVEVAPIDNNAPLQKGEQEMASGDGPVRMITHPDGSSTVKTAGLGTATVRMVPETQAMRIVVDTMTLDGFANILTSLILQTGSGGGQPVVNMTGLKGNYQVSVDIPIAGLMATAQSQGGAPGANGGAEGTAGAPEASDPGGGQTISKSLEALGLRLQARKAPVQQLVIDHAERVPVAN
jgi:uncharacterized protein (TIGR03435 family)